LSFFYDAHLAHHPSIDGGKFAWSESHRNSDGTDLSALLVAIRIETSRAPGQMTKAKVSQPAYHALKKTMSEKTYLIHFKPPETSVERVRAAAAEVVDGYPMLYDDEGELAGMFLMEIVEAWSAEILS
jgi:hypothetical protein